MDKSISFRSNSTELKDGRGREIKEGDLLIRANRWGSNSPWLEICTVTSIKNGKIYLDNSQQPIKYPARCLIVTKWELGM